MQDAVRPSEEAFKAMYERGYLTWSNLHKLVTASSSNTFLQDSLSQIHTAFPHHLAFPENLIIDEWFSNSALVKGKSTWKTASGCDLPSFDEELLVPIATSSPTTLLISDTQNLRFNSTRTFEDDDDHTAIIILAWTYILSARWAELIPEARGPEYTKYMARWINTDSLLNPSPDDPANTIVYLGEVDDDATRWWSAVLAIECGWNASIQTDRGKTLYPPWYTKIVFDKKFTISRIQKPHDVPGQIGPPSFTTALRYLSEYCQLHGVDGQNQAALAASLLIPAARFDNRMIQIPAPRFGSLQTNENHISFEKSSWRNNISQLDKLLTLSCNPVGVKALLTSIFFEPGVECNVCGAWLQGTFEFLDSLKDQHLLLRILMVRDPSIAFLWIGAFITGFHTRALQETRGGSWKTDLHTAAWTGTLMSFIQEPVSVLPTGADRISRADECKLLFLSHDQAYINPPLFPFPPFGSTALEDTNLEVREHAGCKPGHGLQYQSFTWQITTNTHEPTIIKLPKDFTLRPKNGQPSAISGNLSITYNNLDSEDDDVFASVTRNIFTWLRDDDGFPVAERVIREHEWIDNLDSEDEEEHIQTGEALSSAGGRLHGWLLKSVTTRSASI